MDAVKLMNRTDTKFAFNAALLPDLLRQCKSQYSILEVNGKRVSAYKTLYFDTAEHQLFLDHHHEKPNRFKIRIRNYVESGLFYLEIKIKEKGRTIKSRIKLNGFEFELSEKSRDFIKKITGEEISVQPVLWNYFNRITLVNNSEKERLTIDFGLGFEDMKGKKSDVGRLIIAEVKQEKRSRSSHIIQLLRKNGIRESGLSKYCIGSVLTDHQLKYNNFKEKILFINKTTKAA